MTSLNKANRRVGSLFAVAALVLATVTPGLVPAFASAAQLSERSVQLSSASKEATGVSYLVTFTPVASAKAVVVDFCSDSPLVGATCTTPAGFTAAAAATVGGFTRTTGGSNDANTAIYTGTVTAATPVALTVNNVTNPDEAGALYVRIVTYDGDDVEAAETAAKAYTSTNLGSDDVDRGSAAASITDTIGVSGAVLETMTFCVAGVLISAENCVGADALAPPVVKLGEASTNALSALAISEGSIFSQISTNALSGAVVNLKSSTTSCGGLVRPGATNCDITPALGDGISAGQAKFGVRVAAAADPTGDNNNGTFRAAGDTPYYSDSVFKLNYVAGNGTGITSPYGDTFLDTDDAPVNNKNVQITFGASVANNTPAGLYSADLSLIATGKF